MFPENSEYEFQSDKLKKANATSVGYLDFWRIGDKKKKNFHRMYVCKRILEKEQT